MYSPSGFSGEAVQSISPFGFGLLTRLPPPRHRHTHTQTDIRTSQRLEGTLNDAALVHPGSPLTPRPLSLSPLPLPPFLLPLFSPLTDPRGGIAGYELERQEREHPGERYVTFEKHPHPVAFVTHSTLGKYTRPLHHRKPHMLSRTREHDTLV